MKAVRPTHHSTGPPPAAGEFKRWASWDTYTTR